MLDLRQHKSSHRKYKNISASLAESFGPMKKTNEWSGRAQGSLAGGSSAGQSGYRQLPSPISLPSSTPAPRRRRLTGGSRGGALRPALPPPTAGLPPLSGAPPSTAAACGGAARPGAGRAFAAAPGRPARWGPGCSALLERPAPSGAPPRRLRRRSLARAAVPPLVFLDPARAPSFGVRGSQGGAEGAAS